MDAKTQRSQVIETFRKNEPRSIMTKDETEVLVNIILSPDTFWQTEVGSVDKTSRLYQSLKPLIESGPSIIFLSRLTGMAELKITMGALVFLYDHILIPGNAVMYAYYLKMHFSPGETITLNKLAEDIFPWGFFSEKQLEAIWDSQKITDAETTKDLTRIGVHDNLLDYLEMWE